MDKVTTVRQVLLGMQPYVLVELTEALDNDEFKVSLSYGGGIGVENVRDLLESVLDSLPPPQGPADIAEDESGRWWMGCVPCDHLGTLRMGKARAERDRDEHNRTTHGGAE